MSTIAHLPPTMRTAVAREGARPRGVCRIGEGQRFERAGPAPWEPSPLRSDRVPHRRRHSGELSTRHREVGRCRGLPAECRFDDGVRDLQSRWAPLL